MITRKGTNDWWSNRLHASPRETAGITAANDWTEWTRGAYPPRHCMTGCADSLAEAAFDCQEVRKVRIREKSPGVVSLQYLLYPSFNQNIVERLALRRLLEELVDAKKSVVTRVNVSSWE